MRGRGVELLAFEIEIVSENPFETVVRGRLCTVYLCYRFAKRRGDLT